MLNTGTMRLGEGTVSHDADTEVSEHLPWEHITGMKPALAF